MKLVLTRGEQLHPVNKGQEEYAALKVHSDWRALGAYVR